MMTSFTTTSLNLEAAAVATGQPHLRYAGAKRRLGQFTALAWEAAR